MGGSAQFTSADVALTMRYTILLHYPEMGAEDLDPETMAEGQRAFNNFASEMHAAGILRAAEIFAPSSNTVTLSMADGMVNRHDGPFAEPEFKLGGIIVIEVADQDAAITWASRAPSLGWGAVEVRPQSVFTRDGVWTPNT